MSIKVVLYKVLIKNIGIFIFIMYNRWIKIIIKITERRIV